MPGVTRMARPASPAMKLSEVSAAANPTGLELKASSMTIEPSACGFTSMRWAICGVDFSAVTRSSGLAPSAHAAANASAMLPAWCRPNSGAFSA